jgi:hypothetical protein
MAALTPEQRAKMCSDTRAQAISFIEDIAHIRDLVGPRDIKAAEIRRLSGVLRRLLIDGGDGSGLKKIAAPRIGAVHVRSPDNKAMYKACEKKQVDYFVSGGTGLFGILLRGICGGPGRHPEIDPDQTVDLRLDSFVTQKVIFVLGQWVSRADIIKYVANVADGVHSGSPKEPVHHVIGRARKRTLIRLRDGVTQIMFNQADGENNELPAYDPTTVDIALLELLSGASFYLANSPDIIRLEAEIAKEIGAPPSQPL